MRSISHEELKSALKKAYHTKVTPFIWGATGIGKSETVRQAAQELAKELKLSYAEGGQPEEGKFTVIDVRLSQMDPSDLRGLPYVTKEGKTGWAYPSWLPTTGKGVILLDEVNLAPPLVQSSAYQLVLDRKLGDYVLPEGWGIVAAGNRAEDKAYTFELAGPLCNRFIHVELAVPPIADWTAWAIDKQIDSRIVTFLNFKPQHLYKFDSKLKEKAFPTPRSWARYCSPLISDVTDNQDLMILMSSAVGEGVATECIAYLKLIKQIDLKDILEHPEKAGQITGIDVRYSLVSALSELVKKDTKTTLPKVCKVAEHFEAEFAILLLRFIKGNVPKLLEFIQKDKGVAEVYKKYMKYVMSE
jgi:hypothetical protein